MILLIIDDSSSVDVMSKMKFLFCLHILGFIVTKPSTFIIPELKLEYLISASEFIFDAVRIQDSTPTPSNVSPSKLINEII